MAFTPYITYEEYVALGGKVSEEDFPLLERKAQRQLDYNTFNRIPLLDTIPEEVLEVLTAYINMMYETSAVSQNASMASSYSNGVESITFKENANAQFNNELASLAVSWLPDYLTTRSVNFDVEQYLQSNRNNP